MQPIVDISKDGDDYFHCAIGIEGGVFHSILDGIRSLEACLRTAAVVLEKDFQFAIIRYQGRQLGSYPLATMRHSARDVADELAEKLVRT